MAKRILFAAALLLLGALLGNSIARHTAAQHQHTRAVMALAQFHLDRLAAAAQAGQCQNLDPERERLLRVYDELLQAFPLAIAQDPEFRKRAQDLRGALQWPAVAGPSCPDAPGQARKVRDACDECHREYR